MNFHVIVTRPMQSSFRFLPNRALSAPLSLAILKVCGRAFVVLSTVAMFTACDQNEPTSPQRIASPMVAQELDVVIDGSDTYYAADLSITGSTTFASDQPLYDAATGDTVFTLVNTSLTENVNFQTGYDEYGLPVVATRFEVVTDSLGADPDQIVLTRMVGGVVRDYKLSGEEAITTPEEASEGTDPLAQLGDVGGISLGDALVLPESYDPTRNITTDSGIVIVDPIGTAPRSGEMPAHAAMKWTNHRLPDSRLQMDAELSEKNTGKSRGKVSRTYKSVGGRWMLDEMLLVNTADAGNKHGIFKQHFKVKQIHFKKNKKKDALRLARRNAVTALAMPVRIAVSGSARTATAAISMKPPCDPIASEYVSDADRYLGPGIVFQHGGFSDPCTWQRMDPWVRGNYRFGSRVKIQAGSTDDFTTQADVLESAVRRANGQDWIFIGHSNGGIVSRDVAQRLSASGGPRVQGVIAIGSPHKGINALKVPLWFAEATTQVIMSPFAFLCAQGLRGCGEYGMITDGSGSLLGTVSTYQALPMASQAAPSSYFLNQLNSRAETFKKVGIISNSDQEFIFSRFYGDKRAYPEDFYGGRETKFRTARFHKHLVKAAILGGFIGLAAGLTGHLEVAYVAFSSALASVGIATAMSFANWIITRAISGGDMSDGVVKSSSQLYPNANRLYAIHRADTHVGSTSSTYVRDQIFNALSDRLLFIVANR